MERVTIKETELDFVRILSERLVTNLIVVHHTGSGYDYDFSAQDIHQWHIQAGYAGIGYHFVIRKNGVIERGRDLWAEGAHVYGEKWRSIGIQLSGDFGGKIFPTDAQIESAAMLIANLCNDFDIPTDRFHIVGHGELMPTSCPGKNLQDKLNAIVGKANWYRYR